MPCGFLICAAPAVTSATEQVVHATSYIAYVHVHTLLHILVSGTDIFPDRLTVRLLSTSDLVPGKSTKYIMSVLQNVILSSFSFCCTQNF